MSSTRVLGLLAASLLLGCSPSGELSPGASPAAPADEPAPVGEAVPAMAEPDAAVLGSQVFSQNCAVCHGEQGRGDGVAAEGLEPRPVDLTGPRPEHLRGIPGGRPAMIRTGSPGTAMVGYEGVLADEELVAVTRFVHELRHGVGTAHEDCAPMTPGADGACPGGGPGSGQGMGRQMRGR